MLSVLMLLQLTWRLYKENLSIFLGYSAWVLIPYVGILLVEMIPIPTGVESTLQTLLYLTQILLVLWSTIAMMIVTFAIIRKKQVKLQTLGRKAWRLAPHLIVVALWSALVVIGGTILLIIPGLIFWVWYSFAQPEVILHKKRGWEALSSSHDLVRGRFWPVAWRLVAGPLVMLLVYMFVVALFLAPFGLPNEVISSNTPLWQEPILWQDVIGNVLDVFILPFFIIYSTILYLDVRSTKQT